LKREDESRPLAIKGEHLPTEVGNNAELQAKTLEMTTSKGEMLTGM
jgi:hypothetical protein